MNTGRSSSFNKRKIFNDPVYGFINIADERVFNVIEHPYFQRLRRIRQLGLTDLVYPGALHTRFHHSLGAAFLMQKAIDTLRFKGIPISGEEQNGALLAILLHDIGHCPYSHTLEGRIVHRLSHEELSVRFMQSLNRQRTADLDLALEIFTGRHSSKFLHQLVSSQLDVDRLDFLRRDSFYTGVSEGVINTERIIDMLNVVDDELVVEAKGIYSIEKFIVARRLMYWQVYLHKTVIAAEKMLLSLLERARWLIAQGHDLFMTPALSVFMKNHLSANDLTERPELLEILAMLDDADIFTSIKVWTSDADNILSLLCKGLVMRNLFKIEIRNAPFEAAEVGMMKELAAREFKIPLEHSDHLVFTDLISNKAYDQYTDGIKVLNRDGRVTELEKASEQLSVALLSKMVTKYYLCYPKNLALNHPVS
ncbi:MAG: HD domain-containing protein [Bacteroidales bacterium]|nr:HD domain-containing protein [Lentimicrobiaceae bacterium]MDD5694701.1 HD domain-containing protein [Bacteroidales bacterium]